MPPQHEFGADMEFFRQFALPLLGQMRRTQNRHAADLAAVEQFARNHGGFDGLADAYVVGDEQADGIEPERHHQRNELIGPGFDRDAAEAAKRPGGGSRREARRLPQQRPGRKVSDVVSGGRRKSGGFDRLDGRQDAGDLFVEPAQRPHHQQFVCRFRQNDPFAAPRPDKRSRPRAHDRGVPKTSG